MNLNIPTRWVVEYRPQGSQLIWERWETLFPMNKLDAQLLASNLHDEKPTSRLGAPLEIRIVEVEE